MWGASTDSESLRIQATFDAAKTDCARALAAISVERRQVIQANWRWSIFLLAAAVAGVAVIAVCIFLLLSIGLVGFLLDIVIVSSALEFFRTQRKRIEAAIELACRDRLSQLQTHADSVRQALTAAEGRYHQDCTYYPSYPPDWESRRQAVLKRDSQRCTNCGWPSGFLRRARELHVHHVVSLPRGGNNSIENLVTLCHVCHRKVDGEHRLVQNNTKGRRRRYW